MKIGLTEKADICVLICSSLRKAKKRASHAHMQAAALASSPLRDEPAEKLIVSFLRFHEPVTNVLIIWI